jgi:hypothetical protein
MIRLYMDENVRGPITAQLRQRGFDVMRAQDDIPPGTPDSEVLSRASQLNRVLYSEDDDLLAEAVYRQRKGISFVGVIYGHQTRVSIGQAVSDLDFLLSTGDESDFMNHIFFLPLR